MLKDKIQDVLVRHNMTIIQLSRKANIDPTGLYNLMSGKRKGLSAKTIFKIAASLEISPFYFFDNINQVQLFQGIPQDILNIVFDKKNHPYIREVNRAIKAGVNIQKIKDCIDLLTS